MPYMLGIMRYLQKIPTVFLCVRLNHFWVSFNFNRAGQNVFLLILLATHTYQSRTFRKQGPFKSIKVTDSFHPVHSSVAARRSASSSSRAKRNDKKRLLDNRHQAQNKRWYVPLRCFCCGSLWLWKINVPYFIATCFYFHLFHFSNVILHSAAMELVLFCKDVQTLIPVKFRRSVIHKLKTQCSALCKQVVSNSAVLKTHLCA